MYIIDEGFISLFRTYGTWTINILYSVQLQVYPQSERFAHGRNFRGSQKERRSALSSDVHFTS